MDDIPTLSIGASYKVTVAMERREDGGLRVWSDDLPELVLSHPDADRVMADVPEAVRAILAARLGRPVTLDELTGLPTPGRAAPTPGGPLTMREFAARAA